MTGQDWVLLVVLSATVGIVWGRIALRQSSLLESRWADVAFFVLMAGATTAMYAILSLRQIRDDVETRPLVEETRALVGLSERDATASNLSGDTNDHDAPSDRPLNFGYDCSWFALRAIDPMQVALELGVAQPQLGNWRQGLRAVREGHVFVSPEVHGWILVTRRSWLNPGPDNRPDEATQLLAKLGARFPEVQYFIANSSGYIGWARIVAGKFVRKLALSSDGQVIWNSGSNFDAESQLGLQLARPGEQWITRPSANDVMAIAGKWSVDPSLVESLELPPSVGLIGDWYGN